MNPELEQNKDINQLVIEHDQKNLDVIRHAVETGKINAEAGEYLESLYTGGMDWFREVFNVLGQCFGAPKAAVTAYDIASGRALSAPIKIADINPMNAYMVHHRLDADPMRNQFFTSDDNNKINLSVSSIVSVIVGAQKSIARSLDKIIDKYYTDYVNEVADAAYNIIESHERASSAQAIADKIREKFSEKFITNASETVLGIIGRGHEKIAVDLVRSLDKIRKPHLRLQDVWRVKCLFDLVPQARTFIERIREVAPNSIIIIKDSFYNMDHPRNYRDAKIVLNIGKNGMVIPMEIICQVRTFFEFERKNHDEYERARKGKSANIQNIEKQMSVFYEDGIKEYNLMICSCVQDLFERVGWNILYNQKTGEEFFFDGFPRLGQQYYPQKIVDTIFEKLDSAVDNEVFQVTTAPLKLTQAQQTIIFRWITRFILIAAMPYKSEWKVPEDGVSERLFNFIMQEVQRYYKK